jgi:hypothetical protein
MGLSGRSVKLSAHLHLVLRSRIVKLYLHSSIHLQGIVLSYLSTRQVYCFTFTKQRNCLRCSSLCNFYCSQMWRNNPQTHAIERHVAPNIRSQENLANYSDAGSNMTSQLRMCNLPSNVLLSFQACATYARSAKTNPACGERCYQPYEIMNLLCTVLLKCVAETTALEAEVSF